MQYIAPRECIYTDWVQAAVDPKSRLKKPEYVSVDRLERAYALQVGKAPVITIYEPSGKLLKRFAAEELKPLLGSTSINLIAMIVDRMGIFF